MSSGVVRGGGGGYNLIKAIIGMCHPQGCGFLLRFGLKMGIHFAYFVLESGMVFKGTTEAY